MAMNAKQKLLNSAYKRMVKGMDFSEALYKSSKSLNIGDGVLSDCFISLEMAVRDLTVKRDRVTLCQYIDNDDFNNELLFSEASKEILSHEISKAAKQKYDATMLK